MARGKVHPERRAIYKEVARRIVGADRDARKHGWSQNTIGEIERALVAAFLDGCKYGGDPDGTAEPSEPSWIQVPPRSRDTLHAMTFWLSERLGQPQRGPSRIERFEQGGKWRWRVVDAQGPRTDHSVADGSVSPLIKMGLLERSEPSSNVFQLTEQGVRLCHDYWERVDQNDRTLPRISLR